MRHDTVNHSAGEYVGYHHFDLVRVGLPAVGWLLGAVVMVTGVLLATYR